MVASAVGVSDSCRVMRRSTRPQPNGAPRADVDGEIARMKQLAAVVMEQSKGSYCVAPGGGM